MAKACIRVRIGSTLAAAAPLVKSPAKSRADNYARISAGFRRKQGRVWRNSAGERCRVRPATVWDRVFSDAAFAIVRASNPRLTLAAVARCLRFRFRRHRCSGYRFLVSVSGLPFERWQTAGIEAFQPIFNSKRLWIKLNASEGGCAEIDERTCRVRRHFRPRSRFRRVFQDARVDRVPVDVGGRTAVDFRSRDDKRRIPEKWIGLGNLDHP